MLKIILISALWILVSVKAVHAESDVIYLNPSVGYMKFDGDSKLKSKVIPVIGIEYKLSDSYGVSMSFARVEVNVPSVKEDVSVALYYMDGLYYLPHDKHWQPYLTAGVGHRRIKSSNADQRTNGFSNEKDTQLHVGGGVRYEANKRFTIRSEVRVLQNLHNDGTDALVILGISKAFGR